MLEKLVYQVFGAGEIDAEYFDLPEALQLSVVRALNRGATAGRTLAVRAVAADMGLKVGDVSKAVVARNARLGLPVAEIAAGLKRIPLIKFNAKDLAAGKRRKKYGGVVYTAGRGAQARIPNAFIRHMRSGHVGVFTRHGKPRLPIEEKAGPSIGHVFAKHRPPSEARADEVIASTLIADIDYRLARARARAGQVPA